MLNLSTLDSVIIILWIVSLLSFGIWVSLTTKKETSLDYFLAFNSLPWLAVGGSLIATNISAEQFIGMSDSGYAVVFAIASDGLMAAVTL